MTQKKKVTFSDIAKYTNFSKTTVSRYFNDPDSLTLENQQIISDALAELNYKENKVARILANGKTEFVGVIIPDLYHHFYSEILNQILSTYEDFGYKFLVFIGNENEEAERRYIQELMAYQIEGLIVLSHTIPSRELARLSVPVVAIEREDEMISSVNTDNYMGGYQAASLLARHHCETLFYIDSPCPESRPAYGRLKGFSAFCQEQDLDNEIIIRSFENDYEATQKLLSGILDYFEENFTGQKKGIFLASDTLANVLLNLLIRRHGCLPGDYQIIGFDNSPISREAVLSISTMGQQIRTLAYEAVSLLVEQMNEQKKRKPVPWKKPVHKIIPPEFFRRETTEQ